MNALNLGVIIKLEPDFSEGSVSYNSDGTLNRAETKNTLGPHSGIAEFEENGYPVCDYCLKMLDNYE